MSDLAMVGIVFASGMFMFIVTRLLSAIVQELLLIKAHLGVRDDT